MELLLATRNPHKTREFRALLGRGFNVNDVSLLPEIALPEESGRTFEENAASKAIAASRDRDRLVIADDSGLEVDALGGAPGIFSARYAGENASDEGNISKLLSELRTRNIPSEKRNARFRCVIALVKDGKVLGTVEGVAKGMIVDPPRGSGGFGYDPVFQPSGFAQTFGQMTSEEKNKISHRARAIVALRDLLRKIDS
jgi:XTP/dITP diphosphohydrolase